MIKDKKCIEVKGDSFASSSHEAFWKRLSTEQEKSVFFMPHKHLKSQHASNECAMGSL